MTGLSSLDALSSQCPAFQPSIRFQLHLTLDFAPICVSVGMRFILWCGQGSYHKEEWTPNRTRRPSPHQQRGSVSTRLSFEHEMQRVSKLVHPPTGTHTHTHRFCACFLNPPLPSHTPAAHSNTTHTGEQDWTTALTLYAQALAIFDQDKLHKKIAKLRSRCGLDLKVGDINNQAPHLPNATSTFSPSSVADTPKFVHSQPGAG